MLRKSCSRTACHKQCPTHPPLPASSHPPGPSPASTATRRRPPDSAPPSHRSWHAALPVRRRPAKPVRDCQDLSPPQPALPSACGAARSYRRETLPSSAGRCRIDDHKTARPRLPKSVQPWQNCPEPVRLVSASLQLSTRSNEVVKRTHSCEAGRAGRRQAADPGSNDDGALTQLMRTIRTLLNKRQSVFDQLCHFPLLRMQSRAFNRVRAVRFGEKPAAVREDSCYFACGPAIGCGKAPLAQADVVSASRPPRRLLPACARLARPCPAQDGLRLCIKPQSRCLFRLSYWPRAAALDAFSLSPASSSNRLTSGGADGLGAGFARLRRFRKRERQFVKFLRFRRCQAVSRDSGTP